MFQEHFCFTKRFIVKMITRKVKNIRICVTEPSSDTQCNIYSTFVHK